MISSLRVRLWLTYALVAGFVVCIAGTVYAIYLLRNPADVRRELQRLRLISGLVVQRSPVINLLQEGMPANRIQQAVQRADLALNTRVILFDSSGQLLADSRANQASGLPEWSFFSTPRVLGIPVFRDSSGRAWIYTVTRMQSGQALVLAAPKPRTPVWAILRDEFLPPFIRSVILALVISLIMALWIAQWITKPLQKIAQAAESVSQGRYQQIPLEGPGEVKALAKSFNEMEERVQASQRSQRDLIANVSHDLKTPLTSIQGFAQAILDGTANDADSSRQAASVIYSEAERMRRMVMDLLELARLDAGVVELKLTQVDLSALLRGVVEDFLPLAKQAQVDLQITADPGLLVVGDADRLAQVFTNLVDNSLKFTQAGGKVTLSAHPSDGWVEVNVCDTGPGIPPEELERIFERFYQIDKSRRGGEGRGVGLGLAIAREILHAHGGSITARNLNEIAAVQDQKSASGSGAVFTVRIPVKQDGRLTPSNSLIHSKPPRAT